MRLIERLIADAAFRADFRRDPDAATRAARIQGVDPGLIAQLRELGPDALQSLDERESRSSLAGAMMAAAVEGVALHELGQSLAQHLDHPAQGVPAAPATPASYSPPDPPEPPDPAPAAPAPWTPPEPATGGQVPRGGQVQQLPAIPAPAKAAPVPSALANAASANVPAPADARDEDEEPSESAGADGQAQELPAIRPRASAAAAEPAPAPEPAPRHHAVDPDQQRPGRGARAAERAAPADALPHAHAASADPSQYGMGGTGGDPSPETLALLKNHNVTFDADGIKDLRAGRIDPRLVSVLTDLSHDHRIVVSAMASDHPKQTAGGSISNHWYGRGFDIASIDGKPVGPGNGTAREVAVGLARLPKSIRPSEIGSPWRLPGAAYFTDAAHQNHLHVGFDDPIDPKWQPPAGDSAAGGVSAPAADGAAKLADPDVNSSADDSGGDDSGGDDSGGDDSQAADDSAGDDGQVAEDGGSGDTEAQADAESDGDDGGDDDEGTDDASDNEEGSTDENSGDDGDDGSDNSDGDHDDSSDSSDGDHDDSSDSSDGDSNSSDGGDSQDSGVEVDDYPGDSAPKPQIAAWMATQARQRGLPSELPVMASLVESGLKNVHGGDADSVGYFQMRVGIWNRGEYAGYPDHPDKQLDWFLDQAEAVKKQRLAAGRPLDSQHYGDWIADVERPAAQYRGRYQLRLDDARSLLEHAGKSGGSGNAADLADFNPADHSGVQSPEKMVSVATKVDKLHLSYLWGGGHGAEPAPVGARVDCSGYVAQILDVKPRTSGGFMSFGKAGAGKEVTIYANQEHVFIQIGDRFFSTSHSNAGGGPGEVPRPDPSYLSRFVKRHPAGL